LLSLLSARVLDDLGFHILKLNGENWKNRGRKEWLKFYAF
jgi:hypothetical protein